MTIAYVGLGSNLGERLTNLKAAVDDIDWDVAAVVERSSVYETPPLGGPQHQPKFLNQVIALDSLLSPRELLVKLQDLEGEMGRNRESEERWGPRVIDLDILLFGDEVVDEADLVIPHPRMYERAFVLVPLLEIAPEISIPGRGRADELVGLLRRNEVEALKRLTT